MDAKDQKKSVSPTLCVLPWMHMATNTSGQFRVCCHALPGLNLIRDEKNRAMRIDRDAMRAVWDAPTYRELRKQMLRGDEPEMCRRCFREEKAGITSFRQSMNARFEEKINLDTSAEGSASFDIRYLDLRLGNLCNLRCRMCNPYSSNQWVKEWNEVSDQLLSVEEAKSLENMIWPENPRIWQQVSELLDTIEEIYLLGGEPMLIKQQLVFLQACVDSGASKRIILKYNTNLTTLPPAMLALWSHFQEVKLNCSIDGFGPMNDYIRYPSKWSVIDKNLKLVLDLTNSAPVSVQVHTTVQAYNLLDLPLLFEYLGELGHFPYLNILDRPDYLNVRILPRGLKEQAIPLLTPYLEKPKMPGLLRYLEEDWSHLLGKFKVYSESLDKLRLEKLRDIAPDIADVLHTLN